MSAFCQICGLGLTDPESIARGMGPDCAEKYGTQSAGVARVLAAYTDASGNVTHPRLSGLVLRLRAAERAQREGKTAKSIIRDLKKYRALIANFGTAQVQWEGQHV